MTEEVTTTEPTDQVQQEQAPQDVVITLQDLELATRIIGAAIERGAIKAPESEDVGRVWKKLAAFVNQAAKTQSEQTTGDSGDQTGE